MIRGSFEPPQSEESRYRFISGGRGTKPSVSSLSHSTALLRPTTEHLCFLFHIVMTEDVALGDLLDALRARQVPITRDDVRWAFSAKNSRQEAVDFVDQYLTAETLLSQDELDLYDSQVLGTILHGC